MKIRARIILSAFFLFCFMFASPVQATPPKGFTTSELISQGLENPTGMGIAPDGRIFVMELLGNIKIYQNGELLPTPFAKLPSRQDGGLLGIAFDPDFHRNNYVYFYYSGVDFHCHVVRLNAKTNVSTESPVEIFTSDLIKDGNHNGGTIAFGDDKKLYISIGNNFINANSQDLTNDFGKILRINKDGSIPRDNPFAKSLTQNPAIWAYGLRNPFRFQFDAKTDTLYAGDVGEDTWEEINVIKKGRNYGWPDAEGVCKNCAFENPVYTYGNVAGSRFSITMGPVYRGNMFPNKYKGKLFIGDFVQGWIRLVELKRNNPAVTTEFETDLGGIVDIKQGKKGELYVVSFSKGKVYKIIYARPSRMDHDETDEEEMTF